MKAMKTLLASSLLAMAMPSISAPLLLDFEDMIDNTLVQVGDRYKDSKGVVFSLGALIAESEYVDPDASGNFFGPGAITDNRGAVTLNSASNSFTITTTKAYDGMFTLIFGGEAPATLTAHLVNGGTVSSPAGVAGALCDGNYAVCNWTTLTLDLKGQAASFFEVSGTSGKLWFDNMSFSDQVEETNIPEPGGVALSLAALGALAWSRKRRA